MSIYAILSSKPHNPHYLNRYIRFIESCRIVNENYTGYTEKHHICPKAKDLFPEYKTFSKHPWNLAVLTARQHFIAHWLLWKAYPKNKAMIYAFWQMSHTRELPISSRTYAKLAEEKAQASREDNLRKVKDGTHHFLGGEITRKSNAERIKNGTHNWLGPETNKRRVENGTHNWLDREAASERNRKRAENGNHPFLGGEIQRKSNAERLKNGTHHCKNGIPCVNKQGEVKFIPKEEFYNQPETKQQDKEWVATSSTEGKKRRGFDKPHHTKGMIPVVDKEGNTSTIQKEIYKELKEKGDDTYVQVSSKEGQKRLGKKFSRKLVCVDRLGNKVMLTSEQYAKQQTSEDCKDWEYVVARSFEAKRRKEAVL